MMKKLMALVLVLSVAPLATAGLAFTVNGSAVASGGSIQVANGAVTVELVNDAAGAAIPVGWIVVDPVVANPTPGSVGPAPRGTWTISQYGEYEGTYQWEVINTVPSVDETPAGVLFTVGFDKAGVTVVDVQNANLESLGSITLLDVVVPEPATMALLGLGGLLLRRKQ
jgi:hypothetical protein